MNELERLAAAATQGPYELRQVDGLAAIATPKGWLLENGDEEDLPDKAYIAVASPDVILSLIRELKITRAALYKCCFDLSMDSGLLLKRYERELYPETEQPK